MYKELNHRELFNRVARPGEIFEDDDHDWVEDVVQAEATVVGRQEWDSGAPGAGAGVVYVYQFRGLFICLDDFGYSGPYETFTEAAEVVALLKGNEATVSIWVDPQFK